MEELNTFIDNVQNTKKMFVKATVNNEVIANSLNGFVDAQTSYTKEAVKATVSAVGTITNELTKLAEQMLTGAHYKKMQQKISDDLYSTFWKEAFKYYNPSYK